MGSRDRDLHIDVLLSNLAIRYEPKGMIGEMISPVVGVNKRSDGYPIWSKAEAWSTSDDKRSPGGRANKLERSVSSDTFYCQNYAHNMPLTLEDRENMDAAYIQDLRNGKTKFIKGRLMMNMEKRIANQVNSTSNVGSSSGVSSGWSNLNNGKSDPLGDIFTAIYNIEDASGIRPNSMVIGNDAWRNLRRHADIVSNNWGTSGQGKSRYASLEQIKAIFELENVFVGRVYENTADENQSGTYSNMWGDNVLVFYQAEQRDDPSFMKSFRWQRPSIPNFQAEVFPYDPKTKSEEVELGYYQDEKIVASELSFLLTDCNSA
jgi:hypothetical protein